MALPMLVSPAASEIMKLLPHKKDARSVVAGRYVAMGLARVVPSALFLVFIHAMVYGFVSGEHGLKVCLLACA